MAVVTLTIFEGRSDNTKARLIAALTDAVVKELPAKPEHVRVIIRHAHVIAAKVGAAKAGNATKRCAEAGGRKPPRCDGKA